VFILLRSVDCFSHAEDTDNSWAQPFSFAGRYAKDNPF
jgi:hypothetical protein